MTVCLTANPCPAAAAEQWAARGFGIPRVHQAHGRL